MNMLQKQSGEKRQFSTLLLLLVYVLLTMPLFISMEDMITKVLAFTHISSFIQQTIIPVEVKCVIVILRFFGIQATGDLSTIVLPYATGGKYQAQIIWSCIGWQSVVLLVVSLITGLLPKYTRMSRIETVIIGILGTFWVNIFRIVAIYLLSYYFGLLPAALFHNYAGTIVTLIWLFVYWWFSYRYLLEPTKSITENENIGV